MSEKLALVTGASRGIGKACAIELAKAGYDIAVNYAGNVEAANKTVEELKALGVNAEAFKFDVSSQEAAAKGVEEVLAKFGRIDVLVNNAGITRDGLFMRMSAENWDAVINTNLSSAFYVSQPVVKVMMKQRSGAIVNMSSVVGVSGNAGQANYSAAKAGLIGLTKTLAKELGSRGIRVNAIAPGFINTDMTKDLDTSKFTDFIPLKRLGEPEDIAKEWFDMAVQAYADDIDLKPGAADFLESLRQKGYKICIATASDRELYEACLKRNKIFDYFDNFTQSDEVERGKGFPDVYELAAKKCGFGADECVVFEDVYEAVCGAVNGDFYTVAVKDDASNGDIDKIKEKCNLFINDYYDLL